MLIPGSMGTSSHLARGLGNADWLSSASHGAGRALRRFDMARHDPAALGLSDVECITVRPERLIEETPAAYKPIGPVVDIQVDAGVVAKVARLRPLWSIRVDQDTAATVASRDVPATSWPGGARQLAGERPIHGPPPFPSVEFRRDVRGTPHAFSITRAAC